MAVALQEAQRLLGAILVSLRGGGASLESSRPSGDWSLDVGIIAVYATLIFALNWVIRLAFVSPAAKALLRGSQLKTDALDKKVEKFSQSVMEVWIYGLFSVIGLVVVPSQTWVWPSKNWWIGFADAGSPHSLMRDDLRCYYLLYTGRYIQAMASVFLEAKRKDFIEMCIHHAVTVVVCGVSYWYGWNRCGVVVMLILDPADVPLHLAKLCKYTSEDASVPPLLSQSAWCFCADRLFEVFAVVFFLMRLVLYPYVCWSAHVEGKRYFPHGLPEWTCVLSLEILLVLQIYWFSLIVRVAIRLARGQHAEDVRSDDEAEHAESNSPKKKNT